MATVDQALQLQSLLDAAGFEIVEVTITGTRGGLTVRSDTRTDKSWITSEPGGTPSEVAFEQVLIAVLEAGSLAGIGDERGEIEAS